jgi:carbonic anhydrase
MTLESSNRLLAGVRKFRREIYPGQRAVYEQAVRQGQRPDTLFITCADSRIDPELLTQSGPGDLFVTRNIGNLVPAYGEMLGGVSAVIEYAVTGLEVENIVICGHADCGAMKALLRPESISKMPTVKAWLRNAAAALSVVEARSTAPITEDSLDDLTEANVLLQMSHIRTHPSVAGKVAQGALTVHGWVYEIASGSIRIYDESSNRFVVVSDAENASELIA